MENWDSLLATQVGFATGITWVITALKKSKYVPFITEHSQELNKWLGIGAAAILSYGITMQGDATSGWQISIPPLDQLLSATIKMSAGIGLQQIGYKFTIMPTNFTSPDIAVVKTEGHPPKTTVEVYSTPEGKS